MTTDTERGDMSPETPENAGCHQKMKEARRRPLQSLHWEGFTANTKSLDFWPPDP